MTGACEFEIGGMSGGDGVQLAEWWCDTHRKGRHSVRGMAAAVAQAHAHAVEVEGRCAQPVTTSAVVAACVVAGAVAGWRWLR